MSRSVSQGMERDTERNKTRNTERTDAKTTAHMNDNEYGMIRTNTFSSHDVSARHAYSARERVTCEVVSVQTCWTSSHCSFCTRHTMGAFTTLTVILTTTSDLSTRTNIILLT